MAEKKKLRIVWSCSAGTHHQHRWRWTASLCGLAQRINAKVGLVRIVDHGVAMPGFYGVAWRDLSMDRAVAMPVPINVAAALLYGAWYFMRGLGARVSSDPHVAYQQGREHAMACRITDDDIQAFLLRRKIEEANGSPRSFDDEILKAHGSGASAYWSKAISKAYCLDEPARELVKAYDSNIIRVGLAASANAIKPQDFYIDPKHGS